MILRWLAPLLLLVALPSPAPAESDITAMARVQVRSWDTADGLPHNLVHDVAQTPDGYLWFGTWEGLTRFNGYEFTVFDPENTPELSDRGVRALAVAPDGALWMGTAGGGIARIKDGAWTAYGKSDGLAADEILSLLVDARGRVWSGTEAAGISVFDGTTFRTINRENGLHDNTVVALAESPSGEIWVAGRTRLQRITDDGIRVLDGEDGLPDVVPLSLAFDKTGALLLGTDAGLFRQVGDRFEVDERWPAELFNRQLGQLRVDRAGRVWAGSFSQGLFAIEHAGVSQLTTRTGLPNNRITAIFEDREGSIWVGTSGGLTRLSAGLFRTITVRNGLADAYVRAVLPVGEDAAWIATSNGVNFYDHGRIQSWSEAEGLNNNSALSLWMEATGDVLVGTYGAGINRIRVDGRVERVEPVGLPSGHVRSMLRSSRGVLWIGTIRGVLRSDGTSNRVFTTTDGLPRDYTMTLTEDSAGRIWVGGFESLARINDGRVEVLDGRPGYDGSDVFGIHESADGVLWIATESGLVRVSGERFDRIDRRHGLPHDVIFGVVEDGDGYLWMSSNAGVFRARRTELDAVASGSRPSAHFDWFRESHGLVSRQANGGSTPAIARGPDGQIWIATSKGAAVIDPRNLDARMSVSPPASVVIESLLVDGVATDISAPVRIVPGTRHLEFHFAGLKLSAPNSVRYRHRLVGYDRDWREASAARSANYTNLDPRTYRFEVQAGIGGRWNPVPATLDVHIAPHFYETPLFFGLVLVATALVIGGVFRVRLAGLKRQTALLEEEVVARTAALRQRSEELESLAEEKTELAVKLERQARAFERQAREDSLTGVANRRHFDEQLGQAFREARNAGQALAVALLDVDHFKRINDRFSHQVGDRVLERIGSALRGLQSEGIFPARYGGEEFALLFRDRPGEWVVARVDALREEIAAINWRGLAEGLQVTISAGVCSSTDVKDHERMLVRADHQLYRAKDAGRNVVRWGIPNTDGSDSVTD